MNVKTYKGIFKPKNPQKYKGDPTNIIYRSSYELKFMLWLDENKSVIKWSSEEVIIPYKSPIDGKYHRYFVDFYVKAYNKQGKIEEHLIEVKPEKYTKPPEKPNRKTKAYIQESINYAINKTKWSAAEEYCKDRRWKFQIFTEKKLGINQWQTKKNSEKLVPKIRYQKNKK